MRQKPREDVEAVHGSLPFSVQMVLGAVYLFSGSGDRSGLR
jgi:hypothetical protein